MEATKSTVTPVPANPAPAGGRPLKPLASLKAHRRLALALFSFVALAGLPLAWIKGKATYRSEATVYVAPRYAKNLAEDQELQFQSNSQYRQFVEQQVRTVNRYDIILETVARLDSAGLWLNPGETAAQGAHRLQTSLGVRAVPGTYLIAVSLEGPSPAGLAPVVNGVVETYLAKQKDESVYASDTRIENLLGERRRLEAELAGKDSARNQLSSQLGVASFNEGLLNPYDKQLGDSQESLNSAVRRRIEAEAQWRVFDSASDPRAAKALRAAATERVDADKSYSSFKVTTQAKRGELSAQLSQLGQAHPGRPVLEKQIAALDAEERRYTTRLLQRFSEALVEERVSAYRQSARIEEQLRREVDERAQQASWFAGYYHQGLRLNTEIERLSSRLRAVDERIDFLMLESTAPGFVRSSTPAFDRDIPVGGGRKKLFLLFVFAGLALAVAAPVAIDLFDPRIHAAGDLERLAGMPLLGWILERGPGETRAFAAEQERRLMVRLERDARLHDCSTLLFSGVKPGAGTSGMVLELARQLSASGVPAVAVELNAFKPDPRFGDGTARPGVAEVLSGNARLEDAVCAATPALPARIAVAGAPGVSRDGHHGLEGLFERLRRDYRVILIDAAPVLLSADTELQTGLVDAAVLVVEAEAVNRGEVRRALRTLENLEPQAAGLVLNRVRSFAGGGYFADLLKEHRSGVKSLPPKLLRPWTWA